jgi:hypothetical protein
VEPYLNALYLPFWRGQDNDWFKAMAVALSSVNNDAVIIIVI